MIYLVLFCVGGLISGFLLLPKIPLCPFVDRIASPAVTVAVIIPARNEERNLPVLLASLIQSSARPDEVIVVNDGSTDRTAEISQSYGASVIQSSALPPGWTGKTWACHQGALAAKADVFFFLDADTRLLPSGYERILRYFQDAKTGGLALSILPYHRTKLFYEELSLFFNLFMAMGAGGFGIGRSKLFGQSLLITRELYLQSGGHRGVRQHILENLKMSSNIYGAGGVCHCLGGQSTIELRMFPDGFAQLRESWSKAFAAGAGTSSSTVLAFSIYWIAAAICVHLLPLFPAPHSWQTAFGLYLVFAAQLVYLSRQVGTFRWFTALFYSVPLAFYVGIFARSVWLQKTGRTVAWRGREV